MTLLSPQLKKLDFFKLVASLSWNDVFFYVCAEFCLTVLSENKYDSQEAMNELNTQILNAIKMGDNSLAPVMSEADIDYSLVYALHTFVATLKGQICVLRGDSLELVDDSNSFWWLVKSKKTSEVFAFMSRSEVLRLNEFFIRYFILDWVYSC